MVRLFAGGVMATDIAHPRIRVLPDELVGRIAAGEVVERPAAVVKELVDNSLDAGSTLLTVDVADSGLSRISVTDNGEGMHRDDAVMAFTRHATSKLSSDQDFGTIRTLGFRGEALPSIAAVAYVQLLTTVPEASVGTRIRIRGGTVESVEDAAGPSGTRIDVQELFFNTPARKKFLRTPTTEFSHILQVVQQAALAWPAVHVRLIRNGQDVLHYAAVASVRERLLQVYGATALDVMVPVSRNGPGLSVTGVTIRAEHLRGTRTPQEIFVNRRPVKNATIVHAVTDAYGPQLARGRYPQFVLYLEVDPARVDVNVHPTKREIRFTDTEFVHRVVRQAVKDGLGDGRSDSSASSSGTAALARVIDESLRVPPRWTELSSHVAESAGGTWAARGQTSSQLFAEVAGAKASTDATNQVRSTVEVAALGQMRDTYLIARVGDELQVIDQHTAHERVLYERLWRSRQAMAVQAQALLVPVPLELPAHQRVLLEPHLEEFERLGVGIERFGADAYLLRTVPAMLGTIDGPTLVKGLLEDIEDWRSYASMTATMHPIIATLACHSAVRAGRPMALPEIARLIEDWAGEGMIMTCPHGRRVALRLPSDELARIFGRA